jgi:quinol monooxygenase YgiN
MFCETWASPEALAAHAATDDFKHHVGRLETLGTLKIEKFDF